MLFLELGVMPLRKMIKERRLHFLFYILNQNPDSILFKVFEKRSQNRTKKDWVSTVLSDLETMKIDVNFGDIQTMNKTKWKNVVKTKIREESFQYLESIKQKHSKVMELKHINLKMQEYFLPTKQEISKEDIQCIFKMRSRAINVKMNMKGAYDSNECQVCLKEEETQKHIYQCDEI